MDQIYKELVDWNNLAKELGNIKTALEMKDAIVGCDEKELLSAMVKGLEAVVDIVEIKKFLLNDD